MAAPLVIEALSWRTGYLLQVYALIPVWIIATLSLTIITGHVGQVSAGQAALMGIGAYTSALLSTKGVPLVAAIGAALLVSLLGATLLGLPTLRLRGPYFVVTSLAFNGIFYQLVNNWTGVTGGASGISSIPRYGGSVVFAGYLHWLVAGIVLLGVLALGRTRLGKSMMAIRDDEVAANAIGMRVIHVKLLAFMISGLIAGVSGVLMAHFIGFISPDFFTIDQSLLLLTMALLGGVRRPEGAVMGSILMVSIQELFRRFAELQLLFYGLTMLVVILFFPKGILSLFERRGRRVA